MLLFYILIQNNGLHSSRRVPTRLWGLAAEICSYSVSETVGLIVGIPFLLLAKGMRLNTVVKAIIFIQIYFYNLKFLKSYLSADVTSSNISAVL